MSNWKTFLAAGGIVLVTIAAGLAVWMLADLGAMETALAVAFLLLGAAQAINLATRQRQKKNVAEDLRVEISDQLGEMAELVVQFDGQQQRFNERINEIEASVHTKNDTRAKELAEQIELLQGLIGEIAKNKIARDDGGAAQPAQPAEPQDAAALERQNKAELLDQIRTAISENRVDLYLQPVVTLPQRRTRYYEALTRLRTGGGGVIMPDTYIPISEAAGLMPMIDNLVLFRSVRVARRLMERNRDIGVFCNISPHSLIDSEFFPQFMEFMQLNNELSDTLVFEFAQSAITNAGSLELESLSMLRELGFGFSLDHVEELDIDPRMLSDLGFKYVKISAAMLLDGMANAGAQIHAADFKALLHRHGITLLVEHIEDERAVVNLLDYDIDFGQGFLFSEPRLVRGEIMEMVDGQSEAA